MSHEEYVCCEPGCGGIVCFTPEQAQRLRRTHEFWRCPFGHEQHFAGKSDVQLLREQVEALERRLRGAQDARDRARRTCPWPRCYRECASPSGLHIHLIRAHGAPSYRLLQEQGEEVA